MHESRNLQFKVESEQQIFEKISIASLFTLREFLPEIMFGMFDLGFEPWLISQDTI